MSNTNTILENLQGEFANVEKIRSQLFTAVDINPRHTKLSWQHDKYPNVIFESPDQTEVYALKDDKARHLGTVGTIYQSIQPTQFLDSIVNSITECNVSLDLSKLTYKERKDGKIIEFRQPTKVVSFKNRNGKVEEIPLFLNFETGFGGAARTEVGLYSKRLICSNGMRIVNSEIELKAKHTVNMNIKVLLFCEEVYKQIALCEDIANIWQQMDKVTVTTSQIEAYKMKLLNVKSISDIKNEDGTFKGKKGSSYSRLSEAFELEMSRTGKSVFGMLQGATYFTNHLAKLNGVNEDYVLDGSGAKTNQLAQTLAMQYL